MEYKILTYNEALKLTQYDNSPFYVNYFDVNSYKIAIFNYRLAGFNDFNDNSAFEVRGLTFVETENGWKHFLLLDKFFNVNQTDLTLYSKIKNYKIKSVMAKEDGSIISFIKLPNGDVLAKSKMSFTSEQAMASMRIYNSNIELKNFVNWTLENNIVAVFEYVSPSNKIVLDYANDELILLRMRDNSSGVYLDINEYKNRLNGVKIAKFENLTLDEMMEFAKTIEYKEGWVVQFENGLLVKIKTEWYFRMHTLLTNNISRENKIIGYILDETIDDVISQLPENNDELERINSITEIVRKAINDKIKSINSVYDLYLKGDSENLAKSFALNYPKNKEFSNVFNLVKGANVYDIAVEWLMKKTNKLEKAREFLKEYGFNYNFAKIDEEE